MFWTEDINQLFQPTLIPIDYMSTDEKLNTITRLIIFICIILALILQDTRIVLLMIILVLLIVLVWYYQRTTEEETDKFMNQINIDIVDNKVCTKPSKNNPFMNPNIVDLANNVEACPISDKTIESSMDEIFDTTMFRNADDIYDRSTSKRQFYTVPVSSVPNDQATFANWLYNRGKSCKENNGDQCYNNIYNDLRR